MAKSAPITIGPLKQDELEEADRIFRVAFGTFVGMPNPAEFAGDRQILLSRWRAPHARILAARRDGQLIGTNGMTRWGSFAFFGPLTVLPEYWDQGVAQLLLEATVKIFDQQGVKRTGLFTFAHSTKHVGLYQKFGYWPGYLTALMAHTPKASDASAPDAVRLSTLSKTMREGAIAACAQLTDKLEAGLDLSDEIRWVLKQTIGDVLLVWSGNILDAFAVCCHGPGSDGGTKLCYIKFACARGGRGGGERFSALLRACDVFALELGVPVEAGMNLAREDAYRRMRAHGFKAFAQGVSMQRPHVRGHNRNDVYAIDDWR
jgi:GNAT superfamily N-acetyltransferase